MFFMLIVTVLPLAAGVDDDPLLPLLLLLLSPPPPQPASASAAHATSKVIPRMRPTLLRPRRSSCRVPAGGGPTACPHRAAQALPRVPSPKRADGRRDGRRRARAPARPGGRG